MRSRRSDLAEATKDSVDELDKRQQSLIDRSAIPILSADRGRQQSYGSCENAQADASQNTPQANRNKRHQIGSEVLDFGEPPAIWQGTTTQRLSKKSSHRTPTSLLPVLDGMHDTQAVVRSASKRGFFTPFGKDVHNAEPESMGQVLPKRADSVKKVKAVFTLFGLDGTMRQDYDTSGTELGVLLNKTGRPRANAIASSQLPPSSSNRSQSCACPQINLQEEATKSRTVSWSRYLDEISRIGANGASDATLRNTTNAVHNDYQPVLCTKPSKTCISNKSESNTVAIKSPTGKADILPMETRGVDSLVKMLDAKESTASPDTAPDACAEVSRSIIDATEDAIPNANMAPASVDDQISANEVPDDKPGSSQILPKTPAANMRRASTDSRSRAPAGSTTPSKKTGSPKAFGSGHGGSPARACSESARSRDRKGCGSYRGRNAKRGGSIRAQKK